MDCGVAAIGRMGGVRRRLRLVPRQRKAVAPGPDAGNLRLGAGARDLLRRRDLLSVLVERGEEISACFEATSDQARPTRSPFQATYAPNELPGVLVTRRAVGLTLPRSARGRTAR